MKFLTEFRDPVKARRLLAQIASTVTRAWSIMEICGGQTHSIIRHGIDQLLPKEIQLIHGPGCPVCVTPVRVIDQAIRIAQQPGVILCTFGDMLRVPGSECDLASVKAHGGDVRVIYSPLDAVHMAMREPSREVVFLAIGFETTAPANAFAILRAREQRLTNFSALVSHALVPPAIESVLQSEGKNIHAFLAAGHVCSVTGYEDYHQIAERFRVPIVVTGFEPLDLLEGILRSVTQLERGNCVVENAYARVVTSPQGNLAAQRVIQSVFDVSEREWRGMGVLPQSGWQLRETFRDFDATLRFQIGDSCPPAESESCCRSGEVLRGSLKPNQCEAFGTRCTPQTPQGAPMVSSEGACAAYYHHRRFVSAASLQRDA